MLVEYRDQKADLSKKKILFESRRGWYSFVLFCFYYFKFLPKENIRFFFALKTANLIETVGQ